MSALRYPICLAIALVPVAFIIGLDLGVVGRTSIAALACFAYGVFFAAPIADALESLWLRLTDSHNHTNTW